MYAHIVESLYLELSDDPLMRFKENLCHYFINRSYTFIYYVTLILILIEIKYLSPYTECNKHYVLSKM